MTDIGLTSGLRTMRRLDRVWLMIGAVLVAVALATPGDLGGVLGDMLSSLAHTAPFIAFAVLAVAGLNATSSESLVAGVFTGRESRMIVLAALVGGMAPFCSCEVIPFIAAMLAVGAPLSAAMAFWLASPLMDPAMFFITAGALGLPFALAKTAAAVGLGLFGGFTVKLLARTPAFADPLREDAKPKGCCSGGSGVSMDAAPVWRFWQEEARRRTFRDVAFQNAAFLVKWLAFAYLLESLMVRHIPAEWIASTLGGEGIGTILLATILGGPAYLNGYAAVPLLSGLIEQGMSQGAAMAFMLAGGVSCIPAAVAVWALVKTRVFAAYIGIAFIGALTAGLAWGAIG
ncbi:permease [Oceanibium sediminis]|uniref:permease n=1 Tax=Oceanibium sediminis TaxID=2026339 RepID=UPI000DD4B57B|nr:permease [Oceanibium sediminis]